MQKYLKLSFVAVSLLSCSAGDEIYDDIIDDINDENPETVNIEASEELPGGDTTVFDISENAFGFKAANLTSDSDELFFTGNSFFKQAWLEAPSTTSERDGLGPFFNANACATCHLADGRGRVPEFDGELNHGLLLRLKTHAVSDSGAQMGDPIYGGQLQDQSLSQVETEGGFNIIYTDKTVTYPDGSTVSLRDPHYEFTNLKYGPIDSDVFVSPRIANQMIGLGLLEAITEEDILSNVDENDIDGDGVSGRVNMVSEVKTDETVIGRFGWKSNQPNIEQQVAGASIGDLGLTSYIFTQENCTVGADCSVVPNGNDENEDYEVTDEVLESMVFYSRTLAVPARRNFDAEETVKGKQLFFDAQCVSCHVSKYVTGDHFISALENQTIYPYTDLLIHDMGEGLADNVGDFIANGNEWRTAPLWGIGLIETVNNHSQLLHDGRARNIEEAILWHGGEAETAKQNFMNYTAEERQLVIDFIKTL